jgi:lipopolysaccharide/colanic/teichoic acid biosynthesis glycosyltransferase
MFTAVEAREIDDVWQPGLPPEERPASAQSLPKRTGYASCKAVIEFIVAAVLLVLASPVILVIALLTKLTSRGPALYTQTRVGLGGRTYTIIKIRTMTHNCERLSGARWSAPNDSRVTPFGRFLRRTHLDELPQLWNVLRGDMSLIGPRPERPEFIPALEKALPYYRQRLLVRPGVTGLAQVQLPADRDLEDVRRKLSYDLYYVREASFWLDVRIMACTALHMAGVPYRALRKLFRLPQVSGVDVYPNGSRGMGHRAQLQPVSE